MPARRAATGADDAAEITVFDADKANIFAIAIDEDRVFAASSPGGRVYLIEGDSEARVFFDPEEDYIWALAVDADGQLWVGAGDPAAVYRVATDGTSQLVHRPAAAHVVRLRLDTEGRVLAGTEAPGRLYRYDSGGNPFALLDTDMAELSAIAVAPDGVVWAAGVAKGEESAAAGETTSVAITIASTSIAASARSSSALLPGSRTAHSVARRASSGQGASSRAATSISRERILSSSLSRSTTRAPLS